MGQPEKIVQRFCNSVLGRELQKLSDSQLLERFIVYGDSLAFEVIVRRYVALVFGVCFRILRNHTDAEDALQATFLVLFQKARSIRPKNQLSQWLYGVARRVALKSRTAQQKRQQKEQNHKPVLHYVAADDLERQEQLQLLERVLHGLPAHYRIPIMLCDIQELSRKDAAQQLEIPEGTLSSRLAKARQLLATRLSRSGISMPAALTALSMPGHASSLAQQVQSLLSFTQNGANSATTAHLLAQGVIRTMTITKTFRIAMIVGFLLMLAPGYLLIARFAGPNEPLANASQKQSTRMQAKPPEPISLPELPPFEMNHWTYADTWKKNQELAKNLDHSIDMRDFQLPMQLRETLGLLYEKLYSEKIEFPIIVDESAFQFAKAKGTGKVLDSEIYQRNVKFPPLPRKMTVETLLSTALDQAKYTNQKYDPTFMIKDGQLFITTTEKASLPYLLQTKFVAEFKKTPFQLAMKEIAARTGLTIGLDPHAGEALNTPVTAMFRNTASTKSAIEILSRSVGLRAEYLDSAVFITLPE